MDFEHDVKQPLNAGALRPRDPAYGEQQAQRVAYPAREVAGRSLAPGPTREGPPALLALAEQEKVIALLETELTRLFGRLQVVSSRHDNGTTPGHPHIPTPGSSELVSIIGMNTGHLLALVALVRDGYEQLEV